MSEVTAVRTVDAEAEPPQSAGPLRRVRRIGYWVLGAQLAVFLAWSLVLYDHYALTWDFATYYQPWFEIAHGNLDPYTTILHIPFWQSDAEFMPWALAPLYWLFGSGLGLLWLQDLSVVGAEVVVFGWICDLAARHCRGKDAAMLGGLGLVLLAANPWIWWAVSFDVHEEVLVVVFVALIVRDMTRGSRMVWVWMVPVLLGGAPTTSYLIGIGLGGLLVRQTRRAGMGLLLVGVAYSLFIVAVHGDMGVPLPKAFGYLASANGHVPPNLTFLGLMKGIVSHPGNIVHALWSKRLDAFANLAPEGLLGIAVPILMPLLLVVLGTNMLSMGFQFAEPLFQSIPVYVLVPVGTVLVIGWILRRHRRAAWTLGALLVVQALGWAVIWGPITPGQWLRVPSATAATLASAQARIPPSEAVVVSQGVIGRFAGRAHVYALFSGTPIPIHGPTWFVIAPQEGTETLSAAATKTLIGELAGPLGARLVLHANGVWAFAWNPPPAMRSLDLPGLLSPLPAWTSPGVAGRAVMAGPEASWHVTSTGSRGYVADQLEWQAPPSRYDAAVTLSASGPVNVEVWNDTGNTLLARRAITSTGGVQTITMPVDATTAYRASVYSGWGPFRAQFVPPPPGEQLEVRVWSPGGTFVSVYSAVLTAAPAARVPVTIPPAHSARKEAVHGRQPHIRQ